LNITDLKKKKMCQFPWYSWLLIAALLAVVGLNGLWCAHLYHQRSNPVIKALHYRFLALMTFSMTGSALIELGRYSWQICVIAETDSLESPESVWMVQGDIVWHLLMGFMVNLMISANLGRVFQYVFIFYRTSTRPDPGLRYFWGGISVFMTYWAVTRFVYIQGRLGHWPMQWYSYLYLLHILLYLASASVAFPLALRRVATRYFDVILQCVASLVVFICSVMFAVTLVVLDDNIYVKSSVRVGTTITTNLIVYLCFSIIPFTTLRITSDSFITDRAHDTVLTLTDDKINTLFVVPIPTQKTESNTSLF